MCGICGIIDLKNIISSPSRKEQVMAMNEALFHRGPDEDGVFTDRYCDLAMRRLSIIDLSGGNQPVYNEDKTVCVFMNGEIYNYKSLKNDLLEKGHVFYTQSDTEVLAHLYEEYGTALSTRLKGMFTFCIYDVRNSKFVLSRDRFGEKPLYYHYQNQVFSFSSEMASLLQHIAIPRVLDQEVLKYYLAGAYVPDPFTLLKNIYTLPPGHNLVVDHSGVEIKPYFEIDYTHTGKKIGDVNEAVAYISPILKTAVNRQQVSDVPIGAFLSGGIDSSTICALLQEGSSKSIDTFTVKFEESSYDESKIAKEVAQRIGSNHHEVVVPNNEFTEDMFWEIIDHVGLPFPDSSAIPVYFISKEIRKYVKVALSGDGGDEIFAGYPDLSWWRKISKITPYSKVIRKTMLSVLQSNLLPLPSNKVRQGIRGIRASLKGEKSISIEIHRMFFDEEIQDMWPEEKNFDLPQFTTTPKGYNSWSNLRKAMYYRIKHKMVNDMLIKVDRMSMANSLEVRAPFLDVDLFEASLQLEDHLLLDGKIGKKIIREVMKTKLPESVFNHPKRGFSIPLHKYQNEAYAKLSDKLLDKSNPIFNVLNYDSVKRLNDIALSNQSNNSKTSVFRSSHQHWTLLMLAGWVKRFDVQC